MKYKSDKNTKLLNLEQEALQPLDATILDLLTANHAHFRKFLLKRLPHPEVAEEILQQSLFRAFEKQDTVQNESNIANWFYEILKNSIIDYCRRHASESRKHAQYLQELTLLEGSHQPSIEDDLKSEVCACMRRLLFTLKPQYADLIQKIDLDEKPIHQVAQELGITQNNLMVRLHRARQALKRSLERSCGTCTEHGCLDCTCDSSSVK